MGICSRREADRYISEGKLLVNGEKASLGMEIMGKEEILLDGKLISGKGHKKEKPKPVLLKYYKPRGIICTTGEKDRGKNVIEAIGYKERIYPIGRLDKDSEGLLLLTNQGDLVNQINKARLQGKRSRLLRNFYRKCPPEFTFRNWKEPPDGLCFGKIQSYPRRFSGGSSTLS